MSIADNKKLVETIFAEISRGNLEGYLARLADDVEFTIMGTTKFSGTFRGKQDIVARLLSPLMSQLEGGLAITVDRIFAEGDGVIVQAHGRSTTKGGKPYNNQYCQVFTIEGAKVKTITEYLDTELVTQAFGR
jgi:uncharacterized protein